MPIQLEKIDGKPIVIAKMSGHITAPEIMAMYAETLTHIDEKTPHLYRITDTVEATSSFPEMLKAITSVENVPGSSSDPHLKKVMFVGTNAWVQLATQMFHKLGLSVPIFSDTQQALDYIEHLITTGEQSDK